MSSFDGVSRNTYHINTFGCQMNVHDSEHLAGVLEHAGYRRAHDAEGAEIVIFNTCAVRQSAEDRVWGNLSKFTGKVGGVPIVAVCGCMAQRHGVEIFNRCPGVDLVFGLDSLERLPGLLDRTDRVQICDLGDVNMASVDYLPAVRDNGSRAWVSISHGCDNSCAYCVVPLVRGRQRSRRLEEIVAEVERLAETGVVEITLLGQNVDAYGRDLENPESFAAVLEACADVPEIRRVKFETSHPSDITDEVLEIMRSREEVCEYLHLPVQSGSDRILEAMGRGYARGTYMALIEKARRLIPGLTVSTDIIVGFPGEEEKDFIETLDLVRRVSFDSAYLFVYSDREGTEASKMSGHVPPNEKSERLGRLSSIQDEITARSLRRLEGSSVEVMVERKARRGAFTTGRTRGHQIVLLPDMEARVDTLVMAKVEKAGKHTTRGRVERVIYEPERAQGEGDVG